jgi:hypothetical protein
LSVSEKILRKILRKNIKLSGLGENSLEINKKT